MLINRRPKIKKKETRRLMIALEIKIVLGQLIEKII